MNIQQSKFSFSSIIIFILICLFFGQLLTIVFSLLFKSLDSSNFTERTNPDNITYFNTILTLGLSSIFSFLIIPTIYLSRFSQLSINQVGLYFKKKTYILPLFTTIILILAGMPFLDYFATFGSDINLPKWLSEIFEYLNENDGEKLKIIQGMLSNGNSYSLFSNILVLSIIPGIVEEFFFRGVIQTKLTQTFNNTNKAVWITAVLFSFFHFQFSGFLIRILLGAIFGYLLVWSKNIWYPIVAHITNNLAIVVLQTHFSNSDQLLHKKDSIYFTIVFLSILISTITIILLRKYFHNQTNK